VSGLVAILLGLVAVVYAVWPWLRGQTRPPDDGAREGRAGEGLDSIVRESREWSVAAGEVEGWQAAEGASNVEVKGE
jgi:hypothetical protein